MEKEGHIERTKQAQFEAINEVEFQIAHWENTKKEYENLQNVISTLPDKISHEVMVPFGKLAFIPGKIIHTNEFMMHLGDTWFADMTAKQVLGLIERRTKFIDTNVEDLNKVTQNIKEKSNFVKDEFNKDVIDIKEDIPDDYVPKSNRKRVSRVKTKAIPEPPKGLSEQDLKKHNELMDRLNQLEIDELGDDDTSTDSDDDDNGSSQEDGACTQMAKALVPTIKFKHSNNKSSKTREPNPGSLPVLKTNNTNVENNNLSKSEKTFNEDHDNQENTAIEMNVVEHENKEIPKVTETRRISRFKAAKLKK